MINTCAIIPRVVSHQIISECRICQQTSKPSKCSTVQPPGLSVQQVLAFMIVFLEIVCSVWAEIVGLLRELISYVSCKWSDPRIMMILQGFPVLMQQLFKSV